MKRVLVIIAAVLCLATGCASFSDIKLTGCDLGSVAPRGLTGFEAELSLQVDNPAPQVTISEAGATVRIDGTPCLYLRSDGLTLKPRTEEIYGVLLHGELDPAFNPFELLKLLKEENRDLMTVDVAFRATLKSGITRRYEYKDLPLKEILKKI